MSQNKCTARRRFNSASGQLCGKKTMALIAGAAAYAVLAGVGNAGASTWVDPVAITPQLTPVTASPAAGGYFTSSVPLKDGDVLKYTPITDADGLQNGRVYYVVGVGSTPSTSIRLSSQPGGTGLITPSAGANPANTTLAFDWNNPANWTGGVPNGVGSTANISSNSNLTYMEFNKDTTIGNMSFTGGSNDLNLISTITANAGPWATLNFATTVGTPTITTSGGKSLLFSDSLNPNFTNNNGKLVISGNQGLVIDNQNSLVGTTLPTNAAPPNATAGAVKFGYFIDWSKFTGALTLKEGAFSLQGGGAANGSSSLPMNNDVILGTGSLQAQLEIWGNGTNTNNYMRGLDGNAQSTVINSGTSGGPALTFGSYSVGTDTYEFKGNMGVPISAVQPGTGSPAVNFSTPGNLRLLKIGAGTQIFSGNNAISNQNLVVVNGGTLSLGSTGTIGTVSAPGQASAATVATGAAPNQVINGEALTMHNGEFKIVGNSANPRSQNFGGPFGATGTATPGTSNGGLIQTNGIAAGSSYANQSYGLTTLTVDGTGVSNQPVTLSLYAVQPRNLSTVLLNNANANGVTTLFRGTNLGSTPGTNGVGSILVTTGFTVATNGYLDANDSTGTLNTVNAAVLRGALADTSASGSGAGFATYDPAVGVRLLNASEQATGTYPAADSTANVRLNLTANTTIAGMKTNTLQLDNTSAGPVTVTNTTIGVVPGTGYAANTYFIPSNGLLFSGNQPITLAGFVDTSVMPNTNGTLSGTANADNEDVIIHSINTSAAGVTIALPVSNAGASNHSGWITYNGPGNFKITGTQTMGNSGGLSFNGTGTTSIGGAISSASILAVNQGTVKLLNTDLANSIPGASITSSTKPQLIVAAGATFDLNNVPSSAVSFDVLGVPTLYVNAGPNAAGGTITNSGGTNVDLLINGTQNTGGLFPGVISGNLNLVMAKTGGTLSQVLTGANTYTGSTSVKAGNTLAIGRYGSLPAGTTVTLGDASNTNGILVLGDTNTNASGESGPVNQEVAGLLAVGTPLSPAANAVEGGNPNSSILTVNYQNTLASDTYTGTIGNPSLTNASPGNLNNIELHKTGPGTLVLGNPAATAVPNYYSGGTVISQGTLSVASDNKLGGIASQTPGTAAMVSPTSLIANNIIIDGGTLQATGTFTLGDSFAASTPATPDRRGVGIGPISGSVGGTGTIDVTATNVLTDNAPIASAGNTGSNNLTKIGLGNLVLNGNSTYQGITRVSAGNMIVNGSVARNASAYIIVADDPDGTFGTADDISIYRSSPNIVSTSYSIFGSHEDSGLVSYGDLLQGRNSTGSDTGLKMQWRLRSAAESVYTPALFPSAGTRLASDVLDLTGMVNSGAPSGETDPYTLQMNFSNSYGDPTAGTLYLAYLNTTGMWVNAIQGDTQPAGAMAVAGYNGSYAAFAAMNGITDANIAQFLGSYGIDSNINTAWAIVDHNSQFAIVAIPEPTSIGLLGIGAVGLLGRRRRRQD